MSPYATNQLAALRTKPNRSPYEEMVLLELIERDAAEQIGEIGPTRKYILRIGGAPVTETETGTSCRVCSRLVAVTMISSTVAEGA